MLESLLLVYALGSVPLPPPPPREAQAVDIQVAVATANTCLSSRDGRFEADVATRSLNGADQKQVEDARRLVRTYILARRAQKKCILNLEDLRRGGRMTKADRAVVAETVSRLSRFWLQQAQYEVDILSRMFDPSLPFDEAKLPARP